MEIFFINADFPYKKLTSLLSALLPPTSAVSQRILRAKRHVWGWQVLPSWTRLKPSPKVEGFGGGPWQGFRWLGIRSLINETPQSSHIPSAFLRTQWKVGCPGPSKQACPTPNLLAFWSWTSEIVSSKFVVYKPPVNRELFWHHEWTKTQVWAYPGLPLDPG